MQMRRKLNLIIVNVDFKDWINVFVKILYFILFTDIISAYLLNNNNLYKLFSRLNLI